MTMISVKEARNQLKSLLERAEAGEEISISRRGRIIARLVPPSRRAIRLPSLKAFRATIKMTGPSLSATVLRNRQDGRF